MSWEPDRRIEIGRAIGRFDGIPLSEFTEAAQRALRRMFGLKPSLLCEVCGHGGDIAVVPMIGPEGRHRLARLHVGCVDSPKGKAIADRDRDRSRARLN